MSADNIEHAGVHYASHTLFEAQRELNRELTKGAAAELKKSTGPAPSALAASRGRGASASGAAGALVGSGAVAAYVPPAGCLAPRYSETAMAAYVSPNGKMTDRLDLIGGNPDADHTVRQRLPPPPIAVLCGITDKYDIADLVVNAEDGFVDVCRMITHNFDGEEAVEVEPLAIEDLSGEERDEREANEFISRNPLYKRRFLEVLDHFRKHRLQRENSASLEDITRNGLADLWSLQWEDLYEMAMAGRQNAAEDMRARLSKVHWNQRLDTRRAELEQSLSLARREREELFHTANILRELDMKRYLSWWTEQLASFELHLLMIEGPAGGRPLTIADKPPA